MKVKFLHIALIICLSSVVYFNSLKAPFQFDDLFTIAQNPSIRSLDLISDSFALLSADFFARPVLYLTLKINYYFGGIDTPGYHLFNVSLHIGISILIYVFVSAIVKQTYTKEYKHLPLFSSLIFAVHPINTEAVTYIISRSILLSTFFGLLMMLFFIKGMEAINKRQEARGKRQEARGKKQETRDKRQDSFLLLTSYFLLLASCLCLILSLGSREDAAIFPILLIIYYYFFLKPQDIAIISKKNIGIFAIVLLVVLAYPLTRYIIKGGMGISENMKDFTPLTYFMTEINVIVYYYIRTILFPFNFNIDPDIRAFSGVDTSTVFTIFFIFFLFFVFRKYRILFFSLLWFFITLTPTSSIIPLLDAAAEHRVYLPMVGGAIFIAGCLSKLRVQSFELRVKSQKLSVTLICLVILFFSIGVIKRNYVWKSAVSIWEDAARKSPFKARVYNALGLAYQREKGDSEKALEHYNMAIAIQPLYADARINKGVTLIKQEKLEYALSEFNMALILKPNSPEIHNNMGIIYSKKGDLNRAVEEFQLALKINPNYEEARKNLQTVLNRQ
ncbi:MAG: tetratricopeptide repeat protein [Nitrospinae bacterium]|nr:tetratricopeptide repeat protein [Nitrospinota bacterium]MBI3813035.1 tetratricopeptide repeat protein [Nitrospinota bacterium]